MKNSFFLLLIVASLTISCGANEKKETAEPASSSSIYADISIAEFNATFAQPDSNIIILDVRTDQEYESGAIPNSVQIDFMSPDFKTKVSELDPSKTYIVYCQMGGRSSAASKIMTQELEFENVKNLEGGYSTWSKSE